MKTQIWTYPLTLLATGLILAGCAALPVVKPKSAAKPKDVHAVVYSLPKTLISVAVPIKQTAYSPSALLPDKISDWPEYVQLLHDVGIAADAIVWPQPDSYSVVTKDVVIATRGIPDADNTFVVNLHAGVLQDLTLELELAKAGLLQTGSFEATNKSFDLIVKVAETAATIATARVSGPSAGAISNAGKQAPAGSGKQPQTWQEKVKVHTEKIAALRKDRHQLLVAGPADGAALKLMLDGLTEEEAAEIKQLTGETAEQTKILTFEHEFVSRAVIREELFILHELAGIDLLGSAVCQATKLAPFPYDATTEADARKQVEDYIEEACALGKQGAPWKNFYNVKRKSLTSRKFALSLCLPAKDVFTGLGVIDPLGQTKPVEGSIFYRIPARATASLVKQDDGVPKDTLVSASEIEIAQFGVLRQLPRKLGGTGGKLQFTLDPDTGALRKLTANVKAADVSGAVSTLGTQAADYLKKQADAKAAAETAAATAADELTILQRQHDILDLQKKIKDLEAAMTTSAGGQP